MANERKYLPTDAIVEVSIREASETELAKRAKANDDLPKYTLEEVRERFLVLEGARKELGLGYVVYVRRLVKKGDLEGMRVKVGGGSRWLVTKESVEAYRTKRTVRGAIRNHILRIDPKEIDRLRAFMKENGIEGSIEIQYDGKSKSTTPASEVWAKVLASV